MIGFSSSATPVLRMVGSFYIIAIVPVIIIIFALLGFATAVFRLYAKQLKMLQVSDAGLCVSLCISLSLCMYVCMCLCECVCVVCVSVLASHPSALHSLAMSLAHLLGQ